MEVQLGSDGEVGIGTAVGRIDWRTGKRMMARDDTFWQGHEALRREQGQSIPQYCEANGLALSTFRHRVGRLVRAETGVEPASRAKAKSVDARGHSSSRCPMARTRPPAARKSKCACPAR